MKTKLSLFLATLVCWTSVAQPYISGTYNALSYPYLDIFDNQFVFGFSSICMAQWKSDTFAQGTFTWVDDRFIEFHAESPKSIVDRSIKVTQTKSDTTDRLTVGLITAIKYDTDAQIVYSTDDSSDCNRSIAMTPIKNIDTYFTAVLPANTTKFYITITPARISSVPSRIGMGKYHSYLRYNTPIFEVEDEVSRITIEILKMEDAFFGGFIIEGDYALVQQDTICWRGAKYVKSQNPNAIKKIQQLEKRSIKARKKHLKAQNKFNKHAITVFHVDKPDSLSLPTNLSGVYYDTTGRRLELFNDKFLFVAHPDSSWQWYDTIYAEATYSREDEQFIQLHAELPISKAIKTIEQTSMIDESKPDSIDFYLKLPNIGDIKIKGYIASTTNSQTYENLNITNFKYKRDTTLIKIRPGKQILYINIFLKEPIAPIPPDSVENVHFGPCDVRLSFEITDDNTSQYTVTIPGLDPLFFGRYYVDDEYVRIKQDTLIWQGRTFVKSKLQRDIEYIADKEAAQSKDKAPSSDRTTGEQGSPQATPPTRPKSPATK